MKFYIIHNKDPERRKIMENEFRKIKLKKEDIIWIEEPNKNDIDEELAKKLVIQEESFTANIKVKSSRMMNQKGLISCTYKHYLALKKITESEYKYGVIIEDNISFKNINNIYGWLDTCIKQLDENYKEWDILFDHPWTNYQEGKIKKGIYVYPKKNEITNQCHGGTKSAAFYLITKESAKKLIEIYIPFNNSPDWWMNDLFRKLNIKSFWVEPSKIIYPRPGHISGCQASY